MAVENPAHGVGDGFVVVVAVDQHGEDRRDRPRRRAVRPHGARPGAFQQLGQFGEAGGGIALGRRRFAGGQADLALGHGEARHRVHHAQHFQPLVAQEFGQGHGHVGRLAPLQRRLVRGGDDDDGAAQALGPQRLLDEFAHFAAAFADQAHDDGVAGRLARQHRQQHRLADARAGEDTQALAAAAGGEDVHGAHAEIKPFADALAGVGRGRRGLQQVAFRALRQRAVAVDGIAETVDDAAEPGGGRMDLGAFGRDADLGAGGDAFDGPERHHQGAILAKTDDPDRQRRLAAADDFAARADLHVGKPALGLDQQAVDHGDAAENLQRLDAARDGKKILHPPSLADLWLTSRMRQAFL